jgi:hypothetical protein
MQRCAAFASSTVPAPTSTSFPTDLASCAMTLIAPGTVIVTSTMGMPPAQTASAACIACCEDAARTTGTIPIPPIFLRTSSLVRPRFPPPTAAPARSENRRSAGMRKSRRRPHDRRSPGSRDTLPHRRTHRCSRSPPSHSRSPVFAFRNVVATTWKENSFTTAAKFEPRQSRWARTILFLGSAAFRFRRFWSRNEIPGSGSICETDNPRRKTLKLESFVILRVLGGSRVLLLDGENEPQPNSYISPTLNPKRGWVLRLL